MRKLASSGIILTSENTAAQLVDDTTAQQYWFRQTSAGNVKVLGPIPYGKTVRAIYKTPQSERCNAVLIGGATVETIVASTRYRIEIWNPESDYEGFSQGPQIYAYTSAATLSGTASTDRYNVYYALASKINAYAGNNVTAYGLTVADYTLGTSVGDVDTNFVVGEIVTQETSGCTAQVAACTITAGTFAGDDAAGKIYLYNLSSYTSWLTTLKTLTAAGHVAAVGDVTPATSNCVVSVTNATTLHYQGLVIVDDAGYFISSKYRGGISRVGLTAGFTTATASVILAGRYAIGCGTNMLARRPVFDMSGQQIIAGDIELNFNNGDVPVAGQFYEKIILEVKDGDEDSLGFDKVESLKYYVLYFNASSPGDHVTDLETAITTVIAK